VTKINKQERILIVLIACEVLLFTFTGRNFFSIANFFECIRLAAEIGLLVLALTPVIVSGGIDLSVGSMMGLCAVSFGALWHDAGLNIVIALVITLLISAAGGAINGTLISRLGVSPLIVTLGTYSLFRGLAEAITSGAKNYSDFPASFLYLGQGYLLGFLPVQTIFLLVSAVGFWLLLHRSIIGRGLYAIGHSAAAARYGTVPVVKRLALAYLLSGVSAGFAGIIYVAHLGQAKSDAGNGYELVAITAVILGGASIYGGSGTVWGSLLGLAAIVLLQNGLRLSGWPAELSGIATGSLLISTIVLEQFSSRKQSSAHRKRGLSFALIAAAALLLFAFLRPSGVTKNANSDLKPVTIAVMPKAKGDPYFMSCRKGAEEAAKQLNVNLIWDGPTGLDAAQQNEMVESWITRRVDAISVAVENAAGISTVLRKARANGIKVVTWDADALPDARDYFVNQATPKGIGYALIDEAARVMHERGNFAIITGALSAENQNQWIAFIRQRLAEKYPNMKLLGVRPSDDDHDKAFSETQTLLRAHPDLKVIVGISAPAVPAAGEAVKQTGRKDVQVIGLSLPNLCRPYVKQGVIEAVVLWNTSDLGYLAVAVPAALARGVPLKGKETFDDAKLGKLRIEGSQVILGAPMFFRKDNIDRFQF
jgi:rhamnose transport system substrate-binding protein